jgi:hypothetical protein
MKNDPRYQPLDPAQAPRFAEISTFFRRPRLSAQATASLSATASVG